MKVGSVDKQIKRFVRGMAVTGLICLPVFGCGKSEVQDVLEQKESEVRDALEQTGSKEADKEDNSSDGKNTEESYGESDGAKESTDSADKIVATPEQIDVNSILEDSTENADDSQAVASESDLSGDPSVDVDLTALSATMVYSEVFQMMYYPEDYIGKTVKMEGLYDHYHDDSTGKDYYSCIIQDATACCAQGIEFQLSDGAYPADATSDVMVKGTFETYEENGAKYCTLVDAELLN